MRIGGVHYLNGKWVTADDVRISAFDLSVVRGYGIFDFLRTYNNKPFRLAEHIDRLFHSAKALDVAIPKDRKALEEIVKEGIRKNIFSETAIKIVVSGGISGDSVTPGEPSLIILFTKAPQYPAWFYEKGVKIVTFSASRFLPEVKSLNYFAAIYALKKAHAVGAKEVLYVDDKKRITECTRSNIFFVKDNVLITPPGKYILKGITRNVVLEIAKSLDIKVIEKEVTLHGINFFSEAFITASTVEVLPVVEIDDRKIGDGRVGKITKQIMMKFKEKTTT